jgi:arsenate reductase
VHPEVVKVMGELGIDLSDEVPKELTREQAEWADVVVAMGCGDACPYIPGKRYLDWDLEDPKGRPLAEVRSPDPDLKGGDSPMRDRRSELPLSGLCSWPWPPAV